MPAGMITLLERLGYVGTRGGDGAGDPHKGIIVSKREARARSGALLREVEPDERQDFFCDLRPVRKVLPE